jgi:hypothetical protein
MATNNKPANTLRCNNIKAMIWQNSSENGPCFVTTFSAHSRISAGRGAMHHPLVFMTRSVDECCARG